MSGVDGVVFPVELTVRAWSTDRGVALFPVQHEYVEMLWLPVIGPSSTWLLRRLGSWALAFPDGVSVVLPELSESLGLGWTAGVHSSLQRSMVKSISSLISMFFGILPLRASRTSSIRFCCTQGTSGS